MGIPAVIVKDRILALKDVIIKQDLHYLDDANSTPSANMVSLPMLGNSVSNF